MHPSRCAPAATCAVEHATNTPERVELQLLEKAKKKYKIEQPEFATFEAVRGDFYGAGGCRSAARRACGLDPNVLALKLCIF